MNEKIITNVMACILMSITPFILKFFQMKKDEREMNAFLNSLKTTTFITVFILMFVGYIYTDFNILSIPTVFIWALITFMFISTYILYIINTSQKDISLELSTSKKRKIGITLRVIMIFLLILSLSFGTLFNRFFPFNKVAFTVRIALIYLLIIINSLYPLKKIHKRAKNLNN